MSSWEWWINLAALGVFVGAVGVVIFMLIRSLPRIRGAAHPICGGCGADASQIDAFICPNCKRDVRECLIVTSKAGRAIALVRHIGILTLLIALVAGVTWRWMDSKLPWSSRWVFQHGEVPLFTMPPIRRIELHHVGQQLGAGYFDGVIHADAYLMNEDVVRLEVSGSPTAPRHRIIDARGKVVADGAGSSALVIEKWLDVCFRDQPEGMDLGTQLNPEIHTYPRATLQLQQDLAAEIYFMHRNAGASVPRRPRGYTSTDSSYEKSPWFAPTTVASWSIVWLGLVAWQIRASVRAAEKERGR